MTTDHVAALTRHLLYGAGFHRPHLRGATVGGWPLNAIDAAALHNLVFRADYRIVPAVNQSKSAAGRLTSKRLDHKGMQ